MILDKLTIKQKKFADEYIISGNATESYLKAYAKQSRASAEANARKLLGKYSVKNYINERLEEINSKKIAKQEEVLEYLTSIMRGEQKEQTLRGTGEGAQVIQDIDVSAKDRIKAAELLGKRYGIWSEKVDMNIEMPTIITGADELED